MKGRILSGVVLLGLVFSACTEPDRAQERLPEISKADVLSFTKGLKDGTPREEVFSKVGRGKFDAETKAKTHTGRSEMCYLWREEGSLPNSQGNYPLWELCFDSDTRRLVFRDDLVP